MTRKDGDNMKQDPGRRNMPQWLTAPIILRDMIRRFWYPHFECGDSHGIVVFRVFSNESGLIYLVPPEDREEFSRLVSEAKARLLGAVGFQFSEWIYRVITDEAISAMNGDLAYRIRSYEAFGGGDVRSRFYHAVLSSNWDAFLVVDVLGLD